MGIPITLPTWTMFAAYIALGLFAIYIGVEVWKTIVTARDRTQIGEVYSKVSIMFQIMRGWQQGTDDPQNEHYAPEDSEPAVEAVYAHPFDGGKLAGASTRDDPPTIEHDKVN